MGIYISGINLPRGKHSIVEITITEDGTVFTGSTDTFHKSDLRAYETPLRHGRLIDADILTNVIANLMPSFATPNEAGQYDNLIRAEQEAFVDTIRTINAQPTIIEAEGKE